METLVRRRCMQCGSEVKEDFDGEERFYVCESGCFYTSASTPPALREMLFEELTVEDGPETDDELLMLARAGAVERMARAAGMSLFGDPPVQLELQLGSVS